MWYCILYTLCWGFGTWQTTFAIAANTNTFAIFKAKVSEHLGRRALSVVFFSAARAHRKSSFW